MLLAVMLSKSILKTIKNMFCWNLKFVLILFLLNYIKLICIDSAIKSFKFYIFVAVLFVLDNRLL